MKISKRGVDLIRRFEGLRLSSYQDSVGVWTVGWGSTGQHVHKEMKITEKEAVDLLMFDVVRFEISVSNLIVAPVSQNQFDALVSFAFNLGTGTLKKSTLLKKVNINPNDPTIRNEFMKYVKAGKRVLNGLVTRRAAEADLYFEP